MVIAASPELILLRRSKKKSHLCLFDKETVSFAAVEVVNPIDNSIVLSLFKVKLYPNPVPGGEIRGSDEFDLQW